MTCDQLRQLKDEQTQNVNSAQSAVDSQTTVVAADYNVCVGADAFPNGPMPTPITVSAIQQRIAFLNNYKMQNPGQANAVNAVITDYQTLLADFNELTDLESMLESYRCALSETVQQMLAQGC